MHEFEYGWSCSRSLGQFMCGVLLLYARIDTLKRNKQRKTQNENNQVEEKNNRIILHRVECLTDGSFIRLPSRIVQVE